MAWAKREAVTNLVMLGDAEGHRKKVGGLLVGTPRDRMYPDKMNYELAQKDGEVLVLSGSANLSRQLNESDVGKFVKCEFTGWGRSANGKYKVIDVNVWDGEVTPDMKKWPLYAETHAKLAAPAKTNGATKHAAPAPSEVDDDDFNTQTSPDADDDLPF